MIERGEHQLYNTLSVCYPCYARGCMYHVSHLTNVVLSFLRFCFGSSLDEDEWGVRVSGGSAELVDGPGRDRDRPAELTAQTEVRDAEVRSGPVRCGLERKIIDLMEGAGGGGR